VSKRWVPDTSPLILLHKIDKLNLLVALSEVLIVPKAVHDELLSYEEDRSAWQTFFDSSQKIIALKDSLQMHPDIEGWGLGRGESEVITYAITNAGYETILDDLEARKCAATFNIPLRGTVGIILKAKKENLIPDAKPLIEELQKAGLRFNENWIKEALLLVGEE
jgi:predicted nucleic acid-binding protein